MDNEFLILLKFLCRKIALGQNTNLNENCNLNDNAQENQGPTTSNFRSDPLEENSCVSLKSRKCSNDSGFAASSPSKTGAYMTPMVRFLKNVLLRF